MEQVILDHWSPRDPNDCSFSLNGKDGIAPREYLGFVRTYFHIQSNYDTSLFSLWGKSPNFVLFELEVVGVRMTGIISGKSYYYEINNVIGVGHRIVINRITTGIATSDTNYYKYIYRSDTEELKGVMKIDERSFIAQLIGKDISDREKLISLFKTND